MFLGPLGAREDMRVSIDYFRQFAAYNHWANRRLYAAALAMPDEPYRRPTGVFFGSLHGTLNHLLLTDRIWLKRLTDEGDPPNQHNAILHEDRNALARARMAEDARLIDVVGRYTQDELRGLVAYHNMSGAPFRQDLGQILRLCLSGPFDPKSAGAGLLSLLARAADVPDFPALDAHLAETQERVRRCFVSILGGAP